MALCVPMRREPLRPGEPAPEFTLPAVNREGEVSLASLRGRGVMIGFFRGLHCPFCRRQIAQLGAAQPALAALGVETLAVINTPVERARLYFRYRPSAATLLSDQDCRSHRAFGIPSIRLMAPEEGGAAHWPTRARPEELAAARIDPTGEIGTPTHPIEANDALNRIDGFELTSADREVVAAHGMQLTAQFLLDREGTVRWAWGEAPNSPAELCRFPDAAQMLAAARALGGA